jgi:hypothetical protein
LTLAAIVATVFFLVTRPNASANPVPITAELSPTPVSSSGTTRSALFGLPEQVPDVPLEETIILDRPLPTSAEQATTPAAPAEPSPATTDATPSPRSVFSVRVLNGNGVPGGAATAKGRLTAAGLLVSSIGTATHRYATTVVYYLPNHRDDAVKVRDALDVPRALLTEDRIAAPADVLVVVGADNRSTP